jgi:transcriptional regulator with PAS, ATPase and Fis domain
LRAEELAGLTLHPEVLEMFRRFAWPGNIRQLANLLRTAERMVGADRQVRREHLPDDFLELLPPAQGPASQKPIRVQSPAASLDELQWLAIREALERSRGNVSAAARTLGVSRNTIYRRLTSQARN